MDKSKEYILQCKKATEIQRLLDKNKEGNYIYVEECDVIAVVNRPNFYWLEEWGNGKPCGMWVGWYDESDYPEYYGKKYVWLPTQEQLQEMIGQNLADRNFITRNMVFFADYYFFDRNDPVSWEKFWLAMVMLFKYEKRWDGKNWKENE